MNRIGRPTKSDEPVTDVLLRRSLSDPIKRFVVGGGKRIRGALTQLAYEMAGGEGQVDDCVFAAIESLHAGSLVIDDIQDGSDHRRGKPTLHRILGIPLAINAGNWMYFEALETLVNGPFDCEVRAAMTAAMIRSGRVCHEGQALDLAARVDELATPDWRPIATQISEQKTGELVRLAMTLGGLAGGGSRALLGAMDRFGMSVGVALQMRNDLDELRSLAQSDSDDTAPTRPATVHPTETVPTKVGDGEVRDDDLRNARVTWPWVWVADADAAFARQLSQTTITSSADAVCVARAILPKVLTIGETAIAQRIDRETRLLGEFDLDCRTFDLLETVLRPIRLGKPTDSSKPELTDVCRH